MRPVALTTLSQRLAARLQCSPSAARRSWAAALKILREALLAGEDVKLLGLGMLTTKHVGPKCFLHRFTGCQVTAPAHRKPTVEFTDELKGLVRKQTEETA